MPRLSRSTAITGYQHYLTPLRRLIFDYDPLSPSQHGIRSYLRQPLLAMAKANPDIEVMVRKLRRGKAAVLRGHYVNGRDKVICVNTMEVNEIEKKVDLLLHASGAKIKHLKNSTLEPGPGGESARGIWSALHQGDGYRI